MKQISILSICLMMIFLLATSCTTSMTVTTSSNVENLSPKTAYLIQHGGHSADMDTHIALDLMKRDLIVSKGLDQKSPSATDLVIKYDDTWRWDIVMYLKKLNIVFLDNKGNILATGDWLNSDFHKFTSANEIVNQLITEMFLKLNFKLSPSVQNQKP